DFVVVGPGASFAISVLNGDVELSSYKHAGTRKGDGFGVFAGKNPFFPQYIRNLRDTQSEWLPEWWSRVRLPQDLDCKNIEHTLCEWLKYERFKIDATKILRQNSRVRES